MRFLYVKEEIDLRQRINRETFEEMTAGFFSHVTGPVRMALETWGGTMDEIAEVRIEEADKMKLAMSIESPIYNSMVTQLKYFCSRFLTQVGHVRREAPGNYNHTITVNL